jgi:hypothetical protein
MLLAAVLAFPFSFFAHLYFDPGAAAGAGVQAAQTLSTYAVLCGYVMGWYRGKPRKKATTYMGRKGAVADED